jgi:hypothetical protein
MKYYKLLTSTLGAMFATESLPLIIVLGQGWKPLMPTTALLDAKVGYLNAAPAAGLRCRLALQVLNALI